MTPQFFDYFYWDPKSLNPLLGKGSLPPPIGDKCKTHCERKKKMKCLWKKCNGIINPLTGLCLMCNHSLNIALEEEIERKKAKAETNWYRSSTDYAKENRLRKKYG